MKLSVMVKGPGYEKKGALRSDMPECSYHTPVLVLQGWTLRAGELEPGAEVVIPWRKTRGLVVWDFVQQAIDAGFPVRIETERVSSLT